MTRQHEEEGKIRLTEHEWTDLWRKYHENEGHLIHVDTMVADMRRLLQACVGFSALEADWAVERGNLRRQLENLQEQVTLLLERQAKEHRTVERLQGALAEIGKVAVQMSVQNIVRLALAPED